MSPTVLLVCAGLAVAYWGGEKAYHGVKKLGHKIEHVIHKEKK